MSVRISTAPALAFFSPTTRSTFFPVSVSRTLAAMVGFSGLFMWMPVSALSACNLAFYFAHVSAGLVCAFIDMGRQCPLAQRVAELGAQKAVGRIAGGTGVKPVGKIAHHCRVIVKNIGVDAEIVVVDDHMDLAPCG